MARIVIRLPRMPRDRRRPEPHEYFVPSEDHEFHTEYGAIPAEALKRAGTFELNKEQFLIYPATFADHYARLPRGPQVITPKDLGLIIVETGIGPETTVLDIGFGSGAVTGFLARIASHVYAYDTVEANLKKGRQHLEELKVPKRYSISKGDAYDPGTIDAPAVDVFILDVPEPWRALATAAAKVRPGGWLVAYTPCITQAMEFTRHLDGWHRIKTCELIEREWKVQGNAVRPMTKDFSHTAFLTFCRKVTPTPSSPAASP